MHGEQLICGPVKRTFSVVRGVPLSPCATCLWLDALTWPREPFPPLAVGIVANSIPYTPAIRPPRRTQGACLPTIPSTLLLLPEPRSPHPPKWPHLLLSCLICCSFFPPDGRLGNESLTAGFMRRARIFCPRERPPPPSSGPLIQAAASLF
jgi:hypothetical protein